MNESEGDSGLPDAESIHNAEDWVDLRIPGLMAEASLIEEWDSVKALNFMRRAYLLGTIDGVELMAEQIGDEDPA